MDDCIFCKLANGDIPTDMVYQDDLIAVFRDAAPQAPVHMLMVPKVHVASLDDLTEDHAELMAHMMLKIKEVCAQEGLENGYRCVINTGEDGQQIYIRELHTSYIVTGGFATVEVADHIWYEEIKLLKAKLEE